MAGICKNADCKHCANYQYDEDLSYRYGYRTYSCCAKADSMGYIYFRPNDLYWEDWRAKRKAKYK